MMRQQEFTNARNLTGGVLAWIPDPASFKPILQRGLRIGDPGSGSEIRDPKWIKDQR